MWTLFTYIVQQTPKESFLSLQINYLAILHVKIKEVVKTVCDMGAERLLKTVMYIHFHGGKV